MNGGEGSYAEPNREFGFGMYEAVRDTFCKKPANGWQPNYGPEDIGLPSFDDPEIGPKAEDRKRIFWDFDDGSAQGWNVLMGISGFHVADGKLKLETSTSDPALTLPLSSLRAKRFSRIIVRMKVSPRPNGGQDRAQLFWGTRRAKPSEQASVSVKYTADGNFHDLVFEVGANPHFTGFLNELRFDPSDRKDSKVEIDCIRMERAVKTDRP